MEEISDKGQDRVRLVLNIFFRICMIILFMDLSSFIFLLRGNLILLSLRFFGMIVMRVIVIVGMMIVPSTKILSDYFLN